MNRAACFVLLSVLLIMQAAWAQEPTKLQDPNVPTSAGALSAASRAVSRADYMEGVANRAMAQQDATDPNLCAILVLPGPADSVNIRFGLFNVIDDRLDVLIMNSFRAFEGQALLHQSVFDTVEPASGTLTVLYPPDRTGKGPVVLSFTEFTQFKSTAFSTDPDTYNDPDFGATVEDMDQTTIELVYSSDVPGSRRCQGTLKFDAALNASIANIVQVFPTPPMVIVHVGYLDNEHGTRNPAETPTPFDPDAQTRLISTGGVDTPHDTGVIRFENRTSGPVTIDRGLQVTTEQGVFQLWDDSLPITLAPGQNLVLAETENFNFDTSDFGLGSNPVVSGSVNGRAFSFTDTARVLLGREDAGESNINESTPYQVLGRIEVQTSALTMRGRQ